jgi:hypothetical protein
MSTIANLRVKLTADSSKLNQAMDKAKAKVMNFATAITGAAVVMGAMIKRGLDSSDAIQKLALRTGASTEALSALEYQAGLSDVKLSDLEDGFNDLNRAMDESRKSTSQQAIALARLGISYDSIKGLQPEQQFAMIADGLNRITSANVRAKIGNDLLGGSYRRLVPLLAGGSAGMRAASAEAARFGLIVDQGSADAAASANDSISKIGSAFNGLSRDLANRFAPAIDGVFNFIANNIRAVAAAILFPIDYLGKSIGKMAAAVGQIIEGNFSQALKLLEKDALDDAIKSFKEMAGIADAGLDGLFNGGGGKNIQTGINGSLLTPDTDKGITETAKNTGAIFSQLVELNANVRSREEWRVGP